MLADLLAAPAVLAGIIAILSWNIRAGLVAGTLLLCGELAVLGYIVLR